MIKFGRSGNGINVGVLQKEQGCNRYIFLRGQSHFSWFFSRHEMLFPGRNSHFGRPKTNFCRFQKWKAKKKKKKVLTSFYTFSYVPFLFSTFPFTIFLLFFSIYTPFSLFPCLLFSRHVSKNFPVRSLWGALCPLPPPSVTPLKRRGTGHFDRVCMKVCTLAMPYNSVCAKLRCSSLQWYMTCLDTQLF